MLLLCGQISMWMSAAPAGGLLMWKFYMNMNM